ncbi:hypothetical protein, partial [Alicyclobacillus fastidiosus]
TGEFSADDFEEFQTVVDSGPYLSTVRHRHSEKQSTLFNTTQDSPVGNGQATALRQPDLCPMD